MCRTEPDIEADDLYKILGVPRTATDKEISAAYKRLALRYHPDKNIANRSQAEQAFKRVTGAYETLRDPKSRQRYNAAGGHSRAPSSFGSFEHADELYRAFFGAGVSTTVPDIDIAGIFNFDQKPRSRPAGLSKQPETPAHVMPGGTQVVIHGLASKPEHNGKTGKVHNWTAARGRYEVSLNCGGTISLRPQNLTQLCYVTVMHCADKPELTGKRGEIVDFKEDTCHYVLLMNEPPSVVELPSSSCVFPVGAAGVLTGLADEKLNGQMCHITGADHDTSRYVVQTEGGRQLKVRFEKVKF
jgi:hypothetical protein